MTGAEVLLAAFALAGAFLTGMALERRLAPARVQGAEVRTDAAVLQSLGKGPLSSEDLGAEVARRTPHDDLPWDVVAYRIARLMSGGYMEEVGETGIRSAEGDILRRYRLTPAGSELLANSRRGRGNA